MKNFFRSLGLFEIAILFNATGIVFIKLFPYTLLFLVITWLRQLWISQDKSSFIPTTRFYFASIPFLLTIFGLLYTTNFTQGFGDVGRMLPYFLFPLTLFSMSKIRWQAIQSKVLYFFIVGLVIRFAIDLYFATGRFLQQGNIGDYFYAYLDSDTNVFSVLTLFGILLLVDWRLNIIRALSYKRLFVYYGVLIFLTIGLLLLQSRIVIVCFYVALALLFLFCWRRKHKWDFVFIGALCSLLLTFPVFQGRFNVVAKETSQMNKEELSQNKVDTLSMNCMSSTSLRLNAVKASVLILQDHPFFGVGSGDWRDEMVAKYTSQNMPCNAKEQTAPHNQYLRTGVKNGFIGILIFFFYIYILLKSQAKMKRFGQMPFLITLVLCGFGYDILDVGSSIPVFAFFSSWLFFTKET